VLSWQLFDIQPKDKNIASNEGIPNHFHSSRSQDIQLFSAF
jgi:hypothetical protein